MNLFERTAIFTHIQSIEAQLQGLKTLIAAAGNAQPVPTHKTHKMPSPSEASSFELSQDEEQVLADTLKKEQDEVIAELETNAQKVFQALHADILKAELNG